MIAWPKRALPIGSGDGSRLNEALSQARGSRGYHSSILKSASTIEPMAGLTPTQKALLKTRADRMNATRDNTSLKGRETTSASSRVEASPGSDGTNRSKDLSTHVSIAGVPLRLKSSHDAETVNELVRMVDEKIRQAMPLTKTGSIQNASILAALNMAEELLLLKRRARELVDSLEPRVSRVIEDLEKSGPTA